MYFRIDQPLGCNQNDVYLFLVMRAPASGPRASSWNPLEDPVAFVSLPQESDSNA